MTTPDAPDVGLLLVAAREKYSDAGVVTRSSPDGVKRMSSVRGNGADAIGTSLRGDRVATVLGLVGSEACK